MADFDWTAFEASIERSVNICSGAKRDISDAIAAGKGLTQTYILDHMSVGSVWHDTDGDPYILAQTNGDSFQMICLKTGNRWDSQQRSLSAMGDYLSKHKWKKVLDRGRIPV